MVVLNNSLSVDVEKTYNISNFNNKNGGLSGNPLFPYTEKLVESVHNNFEKWYTPFFTRFSTNKEEFNCKLPQINHNLNY